jgi:hypothetical protein
MRRLVETLGWSRVEAFHYWWDDPVGKAVFIGVKAEDGRKYALRIRPSFGDRRTTDRLSAKGKAAVDLFARKVQSIGKRPWRDPFPKPSKPPKASRNKHLLDPKRLVNVGASTAILGAVVGATFLWKAYWDEIFAP